MEGVHSSQQTADYCSEALVRLENIMTSSYSMVLQYTRHKKTNVSYSGLQFGRAEIKSHTTGNFNWQKHSK